jgi:hypothetical protein
VVIYEHIAGGNMMKPFKIGLTVIASLFVVSFAGIEVTSAQQQTVAMPQPTVPELFDIEGEFVRIAYNNQGFVTLGYRTAQGSVGEDWMLLDTGITLRKGTPDYTLKRSNITLKLPNGTTVPLATREQFNAAGGLPMLVQRDNMINDSINYFPVEANQPCAMRFFGPPGALSFDQVDVTFQRACVGRLYFNIPGKIVPGQYWLNIQLASSVVQVPLRIMTKDEQKAFSKKWEALKKQHDEALRQ